MVEESCRWSQRHRPGHFRHGLCHQAASPWLVSSTTVTVACVLSHHHCVIVTVACVLSHRHCYCGLCPQSSSLCHCHCGLCPQSSSLCHCHCGLCLSSSSLCLSLWLVCPVIVTVSLSLWLVSPAIVSVTVACVSSYRHCALQPQSSSSPWRVSSVLVTMTCVLVTITVTCVGNHHHSGLRPQPLSPWLASSVTVACVISYRGLHPQSSSPWLASSSLWLASSVIVTVACIVSHHLLWRASTNCCHLPPPLPPWAFWGAAQRWEAGSCNAPLAWTFALGLSEEKKRERKR